MRKNQHRWKRWVDDDRILRVFEEAATDLKWTWELDKKYPKSYPTNTDYLFAQIREELENKPRVRTGELPPPPPTPESLSQLVDEKIIAAVYEDQNDGSYKDALRQAAKVFEGGTRAWRKILRAVDAAYRIESFGLELAPKPRVQFLHRNLLELTESEPLRGLTLEGLVEFFDDMCPCGERHTADAVRKLRKRLARVGAAARKLSL